MLPHDVVIVDETSMVSLPLMAELLDAVRPDARLVLVGDPDQLASVEAGAVLHDIVDVLVWSEHNVALRRNGRVFSWPEPGSLEGKRLLNKIESITDAVALERWV